MALDVGTLASQMLGAALPILKKDAADAESFAQTEFTKIAQTVVAIGQQLAASRNVLLTLQGLALLAVEAAINAALAAVKTAVNTALGVALIA